MENKEEIVIKLKILLKSTRAGGNIADLILNEEESEITILFRLGGTRKVNIEADSGIAIIKDVIASF